jgi:hypothetical protein
LNGEINCLDPGGFGGVTITKSITIDCHEVFASVLVAGTNGISIPFDSFTTAGETHKTVRLRNLNVNGANTGLRGISITGGAASAGSAVFIEDCLVDGFFGAPGIAIHDQRAGGGELYVTNTTLRNNGGTGITVNPASGTTPIQVTLTNLRSMNNNFGAGLGGARVMISNSVFSGNTNAGVEAESPTGSVEVNIDSSVLSGNSLGVQNGGGTTTIRLSNNNIAFNTNQVSGATQSFGNNRIVGATISTPALIGAATSAFGQQ